MQMTTNFPLNVCNMYFGWKIARGEIQWYFLHIRRRRGNITSNLCIYKFNLDAIICIRF